MFRVAQIIDASYEDKTRLQNSVSVNEVKDFADLITYLSYLGLLVERIVDTKLLRTILNTNPETLLRDAKEAFVVTPSYTYGETVFKVYSIVRSTILKGVVKIHTTQTFVVNRERLARSYQKEINSYIVDRYEVDIPEFVVNSITFYNRPQVPASNPKNNPRIHKLIRLYDI